MDNKSAVRVLEDGLLGTQMDIGEFLQDLSVNLSHHRAIALTDKIGMARCSHCDVWVISINDTCLPCTKSAWGEATQGRVALLDRIGMAVTNQPQLKQVGDGRK